MKLVADRKDRVSRPSPPIRTTLLIQGMTDNRCREIIADVLEAVAGVRDVDVNLHRARATVIHSRSCPPGRLIAAVVRAGCSATIATGPDRPRTPGREETDRKPKGSN